MNNLEIFENKFGKYKNENGEYDFSNADGDTFESAINLCKALKDSRIVIKLNQRMDKEIKTSPVDTLMNVFSTISSKDKEDI